jgi:hypothetical protein
MDKWQAVRRLHNAEEKIGIMLEGLRGEDSSVELCRRECIAQPVYIGWSKKFSAGRQLPSATPPALRQRRVRLCAVSQAGERQDS